MKQSPGQARAPTSFTGIRLVWILPAAFLGFAILAPSPGVAASPSGVSSIRALIRAGKFLAAEQEGKRLLPRVERVHGAESSEVADLLDQISEGMRQGGRAGRPEALLFCERALAIRDKTVGQDHPDYASSLFQLGSLYFATSDYARAKPMLERALEIRETTLGRDHLAVAASLLMVGAVRSEAGDHATAKPMFERALAIREAALPPGDPAIAECLNALATVLVRMGDYAPAQPMYERALEIWERAWGRQHAKVATCLNNLSTVLYAIGDYEAALACKERALRIRTKTLGPRHEWVATTLANMGMNLAMLGRIPEARRRFRQAIDIQEQRFGRGSPEVGATLKRLGDTYLQSGEFSAAQPLLERAASNLEAGLGPQHPDLGEALAALAAATAAKGDTLQAEKIEDRALGILMRSLGPTHPEVGFTLIQYARALGETGANLSAVTMALEGEEISRDHLRLTSRSLPDRAALAYAAARPAGARLAATILARLPEPPPEFVARVWDSLIHSRTLVLDEMASRNRGVDLARDPETKATAERLSAARRRLANLLIAGPGEEDGERYRSAVELARQETERTERALAKRSASFSLEQERSQVGFREVSAALPVGSTLIAYAMTGEGASLSYTAFVLAGGGSQPRVVPIGKAVAIEARISSWLAAIGDVGSSSKSASRGAERSSRATGAAVRRLVWDSLATSRGENKRVFIVPDGAIHLVNFAALPTGRDRYLIEGGFVFHDLSAERDLVSSSKPVPPGSGLLAFGDPAFDARPRGAPSGRKLGTPGHISATDDSSVTHRGGAIDCVDFRSFHFPPLPRSGVEANEVASLWSEHARTLVLTGDRASEAAFKTQALGRRVLHLATHGFFLGDECPVASRSTRGIGGVTPASGHAKGVPSRAQNPLHLSGLALAGANQRASAGPEEENGILTAEEIAALDLTGVEWAVLSACDTGRGRLQTGEGVLGLRRAFQIAGASTVIMSLWEVEDESTQHWMEALYRARVGGGLSTADAVTKADLEVLHERRAQARSTNPFYWAAFVAAGDWK